jgi:(1->4)-alpha-D-glucan 1-alpha-D-glucosylmutase
VLIFERAPDGSFRAPASYARDALVANSTHDLPTFAGWCRGADLQLRQSLGLGPGETKAERTRARSALGSARWRTTAWRHCGFALLLNS